MKFLFTKKTSLLLYTIILVISFSTLPLAISGNYYLDCAFGKDDLPNVDILFADNKNGVFAYKMHTKLAELIKTDPCKHESSPSREAYSVDGGGVIHLIKGLDSSANYYQHIPIAILNNDTLLFHTQEESSFSDGRPYEERIMTWGVKFNKNTWDNVDIYLYRKIQFNIQNFKNTQIIEQRFNPSGKVIYNQERSFLKSEEGDTIFGLRSLNAKELYEALFLTQKQHPIVDVDPKTGDIILDGKIILKGERQFSCKFLNGYFYPDIDLQKKYIVFIDIPKKKHLFSRQKSTLKLFNLENNKLTSLRTTKNYIKNPKISPDRKWILFIEEGILYVMNIASRNTHKIASAEVANWAYRFNSEDIRK